jgi:acetylornithine/N-succinyldiaminopimelate aminotransferase
MTLAKGLGGGVPIGAFLSKDYCMALEPGDHGSTYGGNALTTAAAYASTKFILDNDIPSQAKATGQRLMDKLEDLKTRFSNISEVRGKGMLIALEFDEDIAADALSKANETGVLLNMVKPNTLRLMPALNISEEDVDEGVDRLAQALTKL